MILPGNFNFHIIFGNYHLNSYNHLNSFKQYAPQNKELNDLVKKKQKKNKTFFIMSVELERKKPNSPVTVVVEPVVAAQCCQGPKSNGIGEKNLSTSINPHLPQMV